MDSYQRSVLVTLAIPEGQGESYIIGLDFLARVNNITVSQSVIRHLNAYNINLDNVLAFVSESAQYMRKAYKDTLHGIFPNSYHVCCVAHMLLEIFKEMNTLVTLIKKVFCESPLRHRLHVS